MTPETTLHGMITIEHVLSLPLVHDGGGGETIEVFARESRRPRRSRPPVSRLPPGRSGPGGPTADRPADGTKWLPRALRDYRVLLLDQRGTGRSTPYGAPGTDPRADAERLTHFRADAIVQDAERFREHLGVERWSLLGQSFGGFCSLHYLSIAPDSLREVFFTGGVPPVGRPVDDVYAASYDVMRMLNERYHRRFPQDRARLERLLDLCDDGGVRDAQGRPISRRLMRTLGHGLGMNGGAEALHYLLERDPNSAAFAHDASLRVPVQRAGTRSTR